MTCKKQILTSCYVRIFTAVIFLLFSLDSYMLYSSCNSLSPVVGPSLVPYGVPNSYLLHPVFKNRAKNRAAKKWSEKKIAPKIAQGLFQKSRQKSRHGLLKNRARNRAEAKWMNSKLLPKEINFKLGTDLYHLYRNVLVVLTFNL